MIFMISFVLFVCVLNQIILNVFQLFRQLKIIPKKKKKEPMNTIVTHPNKRRKKIKKIQRDNS